MARTSLRSMWSLIPLLLVLLLPVANWGGLAAGATRLGMSRSVEIVHQGD